MRDIEIMIAALDQMRQKAGLNGLTLTALDGFNYLLVGASADGKEWPLFNDHGQPWPEYLAGLHNAFPALSSAAARADEADRELDAVDEALARRKALDGYKTRYEKVWYACEEAGRSEDRARAAEAERDRLLDVCEDKERHMVAYGKLSKELEADRDRLRAWLTEIYALFPGGTAGECMALAKRALNGEPHE